MKINKQSFQKIYIDSKLSTVFAGIGAVDLLNKIEAWETEADAAYDSKVKDNPNYGKYPSK